MTKLEKEKSGFIDNPLYNPCKHHTHNPPTMMVVPPDKIYKHVCEGCGKVSHIYPPMTSLLEPSFGSGSYGSSDGESIFHRTVSNH